MICKITCFDNYYLKIVLKTPLYDRNVSIIFLKKKYFNFYFYYRSSNMSSIDNKNLYFTHFRIKNAQISHFLILKHSNTTTARSVYFNEKRCKMWATAPEIREKRRIYNIYNLYYIQIYNFPFFATAASR